MQKVFCCVYLMFVDVLFKFVFQRCVYYYCRVLVVGYDSDNDSDIWFLVDLLFMSFIYNVYL